MFESPERFARVCVNLAIAVGLVGAVGLVDRWVALPLAGLVLVFAGLAVLIRVEEGDAGRPALRPEPEPEASPRPPEPVSLPAPPRPRPARRSTPAVAVRAAPLPAPPRPAVPSMTAPVPATVLRRFELPTAVGAEAVWLVGDFNDWSRTATPMDRRGDRFVTEVELEPGRSYRYRYLLDGQRWENDWQADRYEPNGFGEDDSIADT